jgi:hypothetical protein
MKKILIITAVACIACFTASAQDQTDRIPADDERRLTQDTVMDDAIKADTAMIEDGKIIEERIKGDTSALQEDDIKAMPNEERSKKNIKSNKKK